MIPSGLFIITSWHVTSASSTTETVYYLCDFRGRLIITYLGERKMREKLWVSADYIDAELDKQFKAFRAGNINPVTMRDTPCHTITEVFKNFGRVTSWKMERWVVE